MKYVWWNDEWHEAMQMPPQPRVAIIRDHMEPLRHMATGEVMDSKSQFRRATRDAGYVELGNDAPTGPQRRQIDTKELRDDISQAISELEQGRPAPKPVSVGEAVRRFDV